MTRPGGGRPAHGRAGTTSGSGDFGRSRSATTLECGEDISRRASVPRGGNSSKLTAGPGCIADERRLCYQVNTVTSRCSRASTSREGCSWPRHAIGRRRVMQADRVTVPPGASVPRQRPARRGEERPVAVLQLWTPDRAAEHPHLVAEGGVLELELRDAPSVGEHSEQANEHEVGEGSQGARMLPATLNESGTEYWSPTRPVWTACDRLARLDAPWGRVCG